MEAELSLAQTNKRPDHGDSDAASADQARVPLKLMRTMRDDAWQFHVIMPNTIEQHTALLPKGRHTNRKGNRIDAVRLRKRTSSEDGIPHGRERGGGMREGRLEAE